MGLGSAFDYHTPDPQQLRRSIENTKAGNATTLVPEFDRGYVSPYFVTDPERMEAVLENPLILIHEKKISSAQDFLPFLEKAAATRKPILIIAEDIEGDALATIVLNKIRKRQPEICACSDQCMCVHVYVQTYTHAPVLSHYRNQSVRTCTCACCRSGTWAPSHSRCATPPE